MTSGPYTYLPHGVSDGKPHLDWRSPVNPSVYRVTIGEWRISSTPNNSHDPNNPKMTGFHIRSPGRTFALSYDKENGWTAAYHDSDHNIKRTYTLGGEAKAIPHEIAPFVQHAFQAVDYIAKIDQKLDQEKGLPTKEIPGFQELQRLSVLPSVRDGAPVVNKKDIDPHHPAVATQAPNKPRSQLPTHPA